MTPSDLVKRQALQVGFTSVGVCAPDSVPEVASRLRSFLDAGRHGQMAWLERRTEWRSDPRAMWPDVKSVVVLSESYAPEFDPLETLGQKENGTISVYAHGRDYHDIVKKRLKRLGRWMVETYDCQIKVFVDTAPVPEKALGQAAGLGWQGKHTNLLSRDWGNWAFLGAIYTTLSLQSDPGEIDHCGSCRACLDICPTNALPVPYQLDARRCISYLTIEHHGPVDDALRPALGNRIYGCDDCLAVCPWNKFAKTAADIRYHDREVSRGPSLAKLSRLDDPTFRTLFSGSPIKRIGLNRFLRNVLYAIGNSGNAALLPDAQALCDHPDATVADAARWAAIRLNGA